MYKRRLHSHSTPTVSFRFGELASSRVSMADLPIEIVEGEILKRLDVKDLIRYRIVSKPWNSFLTNSKFIKLHLDHSYQREIDNDKIGSRRIVMSCIPCFKNGRAYVADDVFLFMEHNHYLLGSSNGLVCISPSRYEFLVINPETREVRTLKKPQIPVASSTCGFGYNSRNEDYMLIIGFEPVNGITRFHMFTLKSNRWEIVGDLYYTFISKIGILTNGALHWVAYRGDSRNQIQVILSFDLSNNTFKEIPHPDDARYEKESVGKVMRLGVMDDSLCAVSLCTFGPFSDDSCPKNIWIMSKYGVKESWKLVGPEGITNIEIVHQLKELKKYIPKSRPLCTSELLVGGPEFLGAPRFIPSLVSPHVGKKPRKKRDPATYKRLVSSPCLEWLAGGRELFRAQELLRAPQFIPNSVSPYVGKKPRKTRDPASYKKTGISQYHLGAPQFIPSSVSPHVGKKPRKTRDPASYKKTGISPLIPKPN